MGDYADDVIEQGLDALSRGEEEEGTEWIEYEERITETDKAVLFLIEGEEKWVPKSQIIYEDEDDMRIELPSWLATKIQERD